MKKAVLIFVIFAVGACLRSQTLLEPWSGRHHNWGGAVYGNIARNFVRYGYWETWFGPVVNSGRVPAHQFVYHYHYPPLFMWLVSLSYHAFGVHEWSSRLVPILFSVASMGLLFALARRMYSEQVALVALLFIAVMPLEAYYGSHVDVYGSVAVFFSLLAVHGYARWIDSRSTRDLALCISGIALGCLTAWYTYFLVPLIILHHLIAPGVSRSPRLLAGLLACPIVIFALFLLHRYLLLGQGEGGEAFGSLLEKLVLRASYNKAILPSGAKLGPAGLALLQGRNLLKYTSPPLVLLATAWVALIVKSGIEGRVRDRDYLLLMLLVYGLAHNATFPSATYGHDYLVACYGPGIALAASVALLEGYHRLGLALGSAPAKFGLGACLSVTVAVCIYLASHLNSVIADEREHAAALKEWGNVVRASSGDADVIAVPIRDDVVFQFYADRDIRFSVDVPGKITEVQDGGRVCRFVCADAWAGRFGELLTYLDTRYPKEHTGGVTIYTIRDNNRHPTS